MQEQREKRLEKWEKHFEKLEKSITSKTKLLVVNSPNNPTGYVYTRREVEKVVELIVKYDLYLLSDEVYEKFLYNGRIHTSPASYNGVEDRIITINSLSKTFPIFLLHSTSLPEG